VTSAFDAAVEVVRGLGHDMVRAEAPFDIPPFGVVHSIEADREAVAGRAFHDIDVLLLPTTATTVPSVDEARANPQRLSAANTMFANYFGLPAISVPCGFDRRGLPLGLQIVGTAWNDGQVLALARQYQEAAGQHYSAP
jgi:aspartyl-tRNA(Asn)/glutamyl-tRNA(Gln) amidotransferase subunit A